MNEEMKKILSRFFLVSVLITCFTLLGAGTLTAKHRSEYNTYRTEYAVLTLKASGERLDLEVEGRCFSFDLSALKKVQRYRKWLYFTPFSTVFFFGESVYDFFCLKY